MNNKPDHDNPENTATMLRARKPGVRLTPVQSFAVGAGLTAVVGLGFYVIAIPTHQPATARAVHNAAAPAPTRSHAVVCNPHDAASPAPAGSPAASLTSRPRASLAGSGLPPALAHVLTLNAQRPPNAQTHVTRTFPAVYVVVLKWQAGLRFFTGVLQRHLVEAFTEDGGDAFVVHGANVLGTLAGGFEAGLTVLFGEAKSPRQVR